MTLEQQIAQKLMLDLRYFGTTPQTRTPMRTLPPELAALIADTGLGGVILFAENLQEPEQILTLTDDLQLASAASESGVPLLISVDQEGGRVCRTPRSFTTAFAGNMALGATDERHGDGLTLASAAAMATELSALGFNVNHAPCVDVNNNPDNPVINVRAFGDDPELVARHGEAQVLGLEEAGVIATLKHFPGHGDTCVDSHTGLPRVDHGRPRLHDIELKPFADIIARQPPGMVMTAHVQYPALDSTELTGRHGEAVLAPATMSRAIITDLLRGQLGYQGVVITDAMDMAGISDYFEPLEAVIQAFHAGVDIALMPLRVRCPADLQRLPALIGGVADAVTDGRLCPQALAVSARRILDLKWRFNLGSRSAPRAERLEWADSVLGCEQHRLLEQQLAQASITQVGTASASLPQTGSWLVLLPELAQGQALASALRRFGPPELQLLVMSPRHHQDGVIRAAMAASHVVIGGYVSPRQSVAELGGMDDMARLTEQQLINAHDPLRLKGLMKEARETGKWVVHLSLRAPYDCRLFAKEAHWMLASYAYHLDQTSPPQSASFDALAKVLLGQAAPQGSLPLKEVL
ncbi:beta-N-acetylhexosaminidase [Ferrimonas sediminum]|uniref:beta-N-acetylhexosaminidase n=1 Tax=Ferrimonas sediminum TaxID=718193 RepID=A0A1G8XMJ0_9GAMM|nr:glycoside hydrolase family 3 protein [Ferrimonas sediminum]SDJ91115.1 beta-N-acetylhexosaminidase [Ferrimonas sediminum]